MTDPRPGPPPAAAPAAEPASPHAADIDRFLQDLPAWLAHDLPADEAAWMTHTQQRHPELAEQVRWLSDARRDLRTAAAQEDTTVAWQSLMQRLQDTAKLPVETARRPAPRATGLPHWLAWLERPRLAAGLAGMALTVMLGQVGWIAWQARSAGVGDDTMDNTGLEWRALEPGDLAPAAPESASAPVLRLSVLLAPQASATDLARLTQGLAALDRASWTPLPDGRWLLQWSPEELDNASGRSLAAQRAELLERQRQRLLADPAVRSAASLP